MDDNYKRRGRRFRNFNIHNRKAKVMDNKYECRAAGFRDFTTYDRKFRSRIRRLCDFDCLAFPWNKQEQTKNSTYGL